MAFFAIPLSHLDHYAWDYDEGPQLQAASLAYGGARLYTDIPLNKPPLLTWYLQMVIRTLGDSVWALRYAVLLANFVGFVAVGALARLWFGRWGDVGAMTLVLLPGELTVRSGVVMNDLPAMTLGLLALWAGTLSRLRHTYGWLAFSAVACAAMLLVHPILIVLVLPLASVQLVSAGRSPNRPAFCSMVSRAFLFGVVVLLILMIVILQVDLEGFRRWVLDYNTRPIDPDLDGDSDSPWTFLVGYLGEHCGLVAIALIGIVLLSRSDASRSWIAVAALWMIAVCALLLISRPLRPHYRVFLLYPLALVGGGALGRVARWGVDCRDERYHLSPIDTVLSIATMVTFVVGSYYEVPAELPWPIWPVAADTFTTRLQELAQRTDFVVTDDPFLAFAAGRHVPPNLADTSYKRVLTGMMTTGTVLREVIDHNAPLLARTGGRFGALRAFDQALDAISREAVCAGAYCLYEAQDFSTTGYFLGELFELSAYRISSEQIRAGSSVTVTLLWRSRQSISGPLSVFVHLVNQAGQMVAQHDGPPLYGHLPVSQWLPGDLVPDVHTIVVPTDIVPGFYSLSVGIYEWPSLTRLPVTTVDGTVLLEGIVPLAMVEVVD